MGPILARVLQVDVVMFDYVLVFTMLGIAVVATAYALSVAGKWLGTWMFGPIKRVPVVRDGVPRGTGIRFRVWRYHVAIWKH